MAARSRKANIIPDTVRSSSHGRLKGTGKGGGEVPGFGKGTARSPIRGKTSKAFDRPTGNPRNTFGGRT